MKTYKLNGLEIYINTISIYHAVLICLGNKIGVTENNLSEYTGEIPENARVLK